MFDDKVIGVPRIVRGGGLARESGDEVPQWDPGAKPG